MFQLHVTIANNRLGNVDLRSARLLMKTITFASVITDCLGLPYDDDLVHDMNPGFWAEQLSSIDDHTTDPKRVMEHAQSFRELEALVRALDNLESISAYAEFSSEIENK